MTEDNGRLDLSRRKLLGSVATIGAAGAIGGAGSMAFFSDREDFANNQLTAGSLDLKVDWEEHYSDWSEDESEDLDYEVLMESPDDPQVPYRGLPDPEDPLIYVAEPDVPTFMQNTTLETFPDIRSVDGVDSPGIERLGSSTSVYIPCEMGADTPEQLDPTDVRTVDVAETPVTYSRTQNEDTYDDNASEPKPLVNLTDVKPGDFGELTLSYTLCDNPGYVWLTGDLVEARENGNTEPEDKDEDEMGDDDEVITDVSDIDDSDIELLDTIETVWWYDFNGNNLIDAGGEVDVMVCLDQSGSLSDSEFNDLQDDTNDLINQLSGTPGVQVGSLAFGDDIDNFSALGSGATFTISAGDRGDQRTALPPALEIAGAELENGREDAEKVCVVFTDGGPNYGDEAYTEGGYTVGAGVSGATDYDGGSADGDVDADELEELACEVTPRVKNGNPAFNGPSENNADDIRIVTVGIGDEDLADFQGCDGGGGLQISLQEYLTNFIATTPADSFSIAEGDPVGEIVNEIILTILNEDQVFRRGTLGSDLQALASGNGIPLDGDQETDFDEITGDPGDENRECFQPLNTNYIGFAWYLPVDHANEIQTDSVSFDLGFYTEQCRHNDGSGMANST